MPHPVADLLVFSRFGVLAELGHEQWNGVGAARPANRLEFLLDTPADPGAVALPANVIDVTALGQDIHLAGNRQEGVRIAVVGVVVVNSTVLRIGVADGLANHRQVIHLLGPPGPQFLRLHGPPDDFLVPGQGLDLGLDLLAEGDFVEPRLGRGLADKAEPQPDVGDHGPAVGETTFQVGCLVAIGWAGHGETVGQVATRIARVTHKRQLAPARINGVRRQRGAVCFASTESWAEQQRTCQAERPHPSLRCYGGVVRAERHQIRVDP